MKFLISCDIWSLAGLINIYYMILISPYSRDHKAVSVAHEKTSPKNLPQLSLSTMGHYLVRYNQEFIKLSPNKLSDQPKTCSTSCYGILKKLLNRIFYNWLHDLMPSDKPTSLIFSLFDITSAQEVPFGIPQYVQCILMDLLVSSFVPSLLTAKSVNLAIARDGFPS